MRRLLLMVLCVTNCWLETLAESGRGPAEGSAYETAMKMTINTETCFELNQQNAKLICRACGNETNTDSGVTWCMTPGTGRPVCGSNSETFHKEGNGYEEVYVTSEDDLLLSTVRNLHESIAFNCTRVCTDGESQEHKTKVTVESSFTNALLREDIHDDMWYENERGRFLCNSGRSYGKVEFTWKFQDVELNFTELALPEGNECDLKAGCNQACLNDLVFQMVPLDNPGPYHTTVKHSACTSDINHVDNDNEYFDYNNEYFGYVSLLMFGEVSIANAGIYTVNVTGNEGSLGLTSDTSNANITVKKTNINNNIIITAGNLTNPKTLLLRDDQQSLIQCHGNHISVNTTPQWFKDNESIIQLDFSTGCDNTNLPMYFTVETNRSFTDDYPGNLAVGIYSSIARLYLCSVTMKSEGRYDCSITIDNNTVQYESTQVMVHSMPSSSSDGISETQKLLIIFFAVLNSVLIVAIFVTLVVWCWMRRSVSKDKLVHHTMNDVGLPAYLYSSLELEATFTEDGVDPMEFPFDQLEFLHVLGEGNFGCVRKARANGIIPDDDVRNIVAVKTLKGNARPSDIDDLRQELHILKKIQPHCNILNLLGYCTKPETPLCLIIEFAAQGSLKHFLSQCKLNMEEMSKGNPVDVDKCSGKGYYNESKAVTQSVTQTVTQPTAHYINTDSNWYMYEARTTDCDNKVNNYYNNKSSRLPQRDYSDGPGRLGMLDIYCFLLQIAKGMEHIGKMKLIHRDLAARNILIAEDFVLKIGDFGLSRNLTDKDYYRKTGRGMIPVRWMAIESLETGLHTYQSDVWSFGVVAWEILTYAEMPYGTENAARSIKGMVHYLKSGGRLACPPTPHGPTFYPMMTSCWAANKDERPSFSELAEMLGSRLSDLLPQEAL